MLPLVCGSSRFPAAEEVELTKNMIWRKSVASSPPKLTKRLNLRLTDCRLGLLMNFGEELIGEGITRVVNGLPE